MKNKFLFIMILGFLLFGFNNVYAFVPLSLVSYDVSETSISPDGDGIKDVVNIDIEYSEQVKSDINILDSNGNKIKDIYNSDAVINPRNKIWDGKDNSSQIVPSGLYTIEILGIATADTTNIISDTSKTIYVEDSSIIPDIILPLITLKGEQNINLKVGDNYIDSGVTATDNIDGDITSSVIKGGNFIDTLTAGNYTITYDVTDNAGNKAIQIIRNITVNEIPLVPSENILIRNGENVVYSGIVPLPEVGTINILGKEVDNRSVLGIVYDLDQKDDTFSISNIQYYESFGSFYLKCITSVSESCDNWQYVVNNVTPVTGIDTTLLKGGESIGLFFGNPHQITFDKTSISKGENITANTQKYNYIDNSWNILDGVTVGVTTINPNDTWNPIIISENLVDDKGQVVITFNDIGNYNLGIKEDFYFPSYAISVKEVSSGNGGGGSTHHSIDTDKALDYLLSKQNSDGTFSSSMYSDWASIAFASLDKSFSGKDKIKNYFENNPLDSDILTDNERHAMALMSLGINPYSGTEINYIKKIVDSFDGEQFGEKDLVNDDIFAIFPLMKAGYNEDDKMIQDDISFILSKQEDNGSFGSIDMTSSFIQALQDFKDIEGLDTALEKAKEFLKESQESNGGFGNSSTTSWAIQAISSLGEDVLDWENNNLNPNDYLYSLQQDDGGIDINTDEDSRIWATSYAIPASLSLSWFDILESFSKPDASSSSNSSEEVAPKLLEIIPEIKLIEELKEKDIDVVVKKQEVKLKEKILDKIEDENIEESENPQNDLSASVGDSFAQDISTGDIFNKIRELIFTIFEYIGRGFYWIFSLVF